MHRQQTFDLLGDPIDRLVVLALWTVSISTTASDPVVFPTAVTLVDDVAKHASPTACDRIDHLAMAEGDSATESLVVRRCVLPKAVRDRGHRLRFTSKQLFDERAGVRFGRLSQMQIDHRGLQTAVAHVLLDGTQADARFE